MQTASDYKIARINDSESRDINQLLDLISLFVHDLEGPTVVMQTILRLLEQGRLDMSNKNHSELVQSGGIAIERARSIIGDLMLISKSGEMGIPVKPEPIPLCESLKNSIDLIRPSARENGVHVEFECPRKECTVSADTDLVLRVMDNLLYNALRHSAPDSTIKVVVSQIGKKAIVSVLDDGPGFEGFDPSDLFDKYKQLSLRMQGKHRGVGLGLYFCHMAVTAMKGEIRAKARPEGGAEFSFTLNIKR
ncbi:MAG: hypothetical protein GF310_01120 [candidate division Zixibacteria bacterium]|nr:hypothetical protein [candidate division Zixibacteria bacterium]